MELGSFGVCSSKYTRIEILESSSGIEALARGSSRSTWRVGSPVCRNDDGERAINNVMVSPPLHVRLWIGASEVGEAPHTGFDGEQACLLGSGSLDTSVRPRHARKKRKLHVCTFVDLVDHNYQSAVSRQVR